MLKIYMIDWKLVEGFDWDGGNARKSIDKHGVSQAEAEQVFFGLSLLVVTDERHSEMEPRFHALGETGDRRRLHVTLTTRDGGRLIRIISARDMSRRERKVHDEQG